MVGKIGLAGSCISTAQCSHQERCCSIVVEDEILSRLFVEEHAQTNLLTLMLQRHQPLILKAFGVLMDFDDHCFVS